MSQPKKIIDTLENANEPPDALRLAKMARNDLGLCERLLARFGDRIAHTEEVGWVAWNGSCWVSGDAGEAIVRGFAHQTAVAIWTEYEVWQAHERARPMRDNGASFNEKAFDADLKSFARFANDAGNANRTNAMLNQAKVYVKARLSDFDKDPLSDLL